MKWLKRLLTGFIGLLFAGWLGLVAYAYWPSGVHEVPAASLAGPADRFVDVDGLQIRYRSYGEPGPDKPTALLIHGFANSLQSFRRVAPLLADRYYVIAYDMPGFGLSSKPAPFDYRNANQARVASDLIRALGLKNVVVGGHSLGGAIALRVAVSDPDVVGLVVMNPGIVTTGVPAIAKYLVFPFQRLQAKIFGDPEFRSSFLKRSFVDPSIVTPEVIADLSLTSRSEGYLRGMTNLMGQYQDADEIPLLAKVKVPSLIVWGAQDRGKPAGEFDTLKGMLPAADTVYVPKSGHYVQEEAPEETATGMKALADRIMAGRVPAAPVAVPGADAEPAA